MNEEEKNSQSLKAVNNKKILWKKDQFYSIPKYFEQFRNKKLKLILSEDTSDEISHLTVIFNYKDKLTYIKCTITDNINKQQ